MLNEDEEKRKMVEQYLQSRFNDPMPQEQSRMNQVTNFARLGSEIGGMIGNYKPDMSAYDRLDTQAAEPDKRKMEIAKYMMGKFFPPAGEKLRFMPIKSADAQGNPRWEVFDRISGKTTPWSYASEDEATSAASKLGGMENTKPGRVASGGAVGSVGTPSSGASPYVGPSIDKKVDDKIKLEQASEQMRKQQLGAQIAIPGFDHNPKYEVNPATAQKFRDSTAILNSMTQGFEKFENEFEDVKFYDFYSEKSGDLDALGTALKLDAKELFNLGVLNGPDLALMERMIPQRFGNVTPDKAKAQIRQAREFLRTRVLTKLQASGYTPQDPNWLKSSDTYKEVNGVRYKKVDGGWQKVK